jgi:multidrug resistance efflux pump
MHVFALIFALLPMNLGQTTPGPSSAPATQSGTSQTKDSTVVAHRGSLAGDVEGQGYFEPVEPFDIRIRPKAYGGELKIKTIATNGTAVKKGEVLLEIDPEAIDKLIAAGENDVQAAHAALTRAEADAKIGEAQEALALKMQTEATQRAEEEVKWFQNVDGPNILLQADQNVKNWKAAVDDRQDELNELKKMYKSDDLTTDTADIVVKRAVRNLENLKVSLKVTTDQTEKTKNVTYPVRKDAVLEAAKQAGQQLESLVAAQAQSRVLRGTGLAATTVAAKAANEHLADLKTDKEKLTVCAPAEGVVLYGHFTGGAFANSDERALRPGEHIAAQQVVMTFYTPGGLRLHLDLPESKFFQMRPGAAATITPESFPGKIEGTCDAAPAIDVNVPEGGQYVLRYALTISCHDVDPKLVPGMRANVHVHPADSQIAVLVPKSAVADGHVWVKTEDGVECRDVTVGMSNDKQMEIKKGLSDGDEILLEARK